VYRTCQVPQWIQQLLPMVFPEAGRLEVLIPVQASVLMPQSMLRSVSKAIGPFICAVAYGLGLLALGLCALLVYLGVLVCARRGREVCC